MAVLPKKTVPDVEVTRFVIEIIMPYFNEESHDYNKIIEKLKNKPAFDKNFNTPEIHYYRDLNIEILSGNKIVMSMDETTAGCLILQIDVKINSSSIPYNVKELTTFQQKSIEWVRSILRNENEIDCIAYLYPLIMIINSKPNLTMPIIRKNADDLFSDLILALGPKEKKFNSDALSQLISNDLGFLQTDFYKFSLYGSLVYDRSFIYNEGHYVHDVIIPQIANIRTAQLLYERLNKKLSDKLEYIKKLSKNENEYEIFRLKELSLLALASMEYPRSYAHLPAISEELKKIFSIYELEDEINKKINVLNSIIQKISDKHGTDLNKTMTIVGILLTGMSVLVAIVGIKPLCNIIFHNSC